MIKREEGSISALTRGINGLERKETVQGMYAVSDWEAKLEAKNRTKSTEEDYTR